MATLAEVGETIKAIVILGGVLTAVVFGVRGCLGCGMLSQANEGQQAIAAVSRPPARAIEPRKGGVYKIQSGHAGFTRRQDLEQFTSDIGRYGGQEALLQAMTKPGFVPLEAGDSATVLDQTFDYVLIKVRSSGTRLWALKGALR